MMSSEAFREAIRLFLADGTPAGLRKARIHGWTGLDFVATASTFGTLAERPEVDRRGVYILEGPDPRRLGEARVKTELPRLATGPRRENGKWV